jgi:hypothetical protein
MRRTEACDEVGREEKAAMLASAADGDEGHLGIDKLAQCATDSFLSIAIAGAHR